MSEPTETKPEQEFPQAWNSIIDEVKNLALLNTLGALEHTLKAIGAPQDTIDGMRDGDMAHVIWWVDNHFKAQPPSSHEPHE